MNSLSDKILSNILPAVNPMSKSGNATVDRVGRLTVLISRLSKPTR